MLRSAADRIQRTTGQKHSIQQLRHRKYRPSKVFLVARAGNMQVGTLACAAIRSAAAAAAAAAACQPASYLLG
jgi:hypothetical protein